MKSSILNLLALSLIISFAAACGKKSDSGSKSSNPYSNGVFNPNGGTAAGQTAYNNLQAWYAAADATPVGAHGAYTEKTGSANFSFTKQLCGPSLINFLCEVPTSCYIRTANGVMNGVPTMSGSQGLHYDGCNITTINQYIKANDVELKEAVQGSASKFLMVERTQQSGQIFHVYFSDFAGSLTPTAYYQINTSLPAVLNPTLKQTGSGFNVQEKRVIFAIYQ